MKTKVAIVLALLAALSIAACSDNDESKPKPEPTKQKYTLADAYVTPTSIKFIVDTFIYPDGTMNIHPRIQFLGSEITLESDSATFNRITRLYCDTACTWHGRKGWPENCRVFLESPLVSIKAIAADDTWGEQYPKGSEISEFFVLRPVSSKIYIESGYSVLPSAFNYIKMHQWQPSDGFALVNQMYIYQ